MNMIRIIALATSLCFGTCCQAHIHYHGVDWDEEEMEDNEDLEEQDFTLSDECRECQFYSDDAYYYHGHYPSYIEEIEHETVTWPGRRNDPFAN